jgi:hypothetical protein
MGIDISGFVNVIRSSKRYQKKVCIAVHQPCIYLAVFMLFLNIRRIRLYGSQIPNTIWYNII